VAASLTAERAVTEDTNQKQTRNWERWLQYLRSLELDDDPFLRALTPHAQSTLVAAFGAAYRDNRFTRRGPVPPGHGTVSTAIDAVAATFRANGLDSPIHQANGAKKHLIHRLLKGYKNEDPSPKHQKAIPLDLLRYARDRLANTAHETAIAQLFRGAIFFAMRSCEYLDIEGTPRRTKKLCVRNLRFFTNKRELPISSPDLHLAETVSINFEFQKSNTRDDVITQHRSNDPLLCPVVAWAGVVQRILKYPSASIHSPINMLVDNGKTHLLTAKAALTFLRSVVREVGQSTLGFLPSEVGVHSIRSGGAMAMYLAHTPVHTIKLTGRWSSDAFLLYIRKQVQEFSAGISEGMVRHDRFFTVPDRSAFDGSRDDAHHGPQAQSLAARLASLDSTSLPAASHTRTRAHRFDA
jgi:hypothetical protein